MKPRTKKFADELLTNPKLSQTEAYLRTHSTTNKKSAAVSASKLLAQANVGIYLDRHISKARQRIIALVDEAAKEEVQLRAAQDVLDRSYGKARQRVDVSTATIQLNIDLTGSD